MRLAIQVDHATATTDAYASSARRGRLARRSDEAVSIGAVRIHASAREVARGATQPPQPLNFSVCPGLTM